MEKELENSKKYNHKHFGNQFPTIVAIVLEQFLNQPLTGGSSLWECISSFLMEGRGKSLKKKLSVTDIYTTDNVSKKKGKENETAIYKVSNT